MTAQSNSRASATPINRESRPEVLDRLEGEIPHLRRWARHLTRDPDLADDMVQECLLRAVSRASQWRPGSSVRAWLFAILKNAFISDRRQASRRSNVVSLENYREPSVKGGQESHMALIEVRRAFGRLSGEHCEVLFLVAIEGMPYEDAAAALGIPVGTVRSRLSRARLALKREIEGEQAPSANRSRRA